MLSAVTKSSHLLRHTESLDYGSVSDLPQSKDYASGWYKIKFKLQKCVAIIDLGSDGLVTRGQTLDSIGNATAEQLKPIIDCSCGRLIAEPELEQDPVQQDACKITRKWPPGCIGAMFAWGEADNQQSGIRFAKRGNGP